MTVVGGNGITTTARVTDEITIDQDGARWITNTSGVDCTGSSDSTSGINRALTAAVAANTLLIIPSGCRLGLASPGPGNAALSIPSGARIFCEDSTAGFFAVRKRCVGGAYPDA